MEYRPSIRDFYASCTRRFFFLEEKRAPRLWSQLVEEMTQSQRFRGFVIRNNGSEKNKTIDKYSKLSHKQRSLRISHYLNGLIGWRLASLLFFCVLTSVYHVVSPVETMDPIKPLQLQILVLGMHHSGTSLLTKLLIDMGVFAGDNLLMLKGQPLKYFENVDVVNLDKKLIADGRTRFGPWWVGYGYRQSRVSSSLLADLESGSRDIVDAMNRNSGGASWVIKDPRLCLVGDAYMEHMVRPICVLSMRDPGVIAHRMIRYNTPRGKLSLREWAQVWEEYTSQAVRSCLMRHATILYVDHDQIVSNAYDVSVALAKQLNELGASDLSPMSRNHFDQTFSSLLRPPQPTRVESDIKSFVSPRAALLWHSLQQKNVHTIDINLIESSSWLESPVRTLNPPTESFKTELPVLNTPNAYVTMVSGNNKGYVSGALVLGESIRAFDKTTDMVALFTVEVTNPAIHQVLQDAGWIVKYVPKIEEPWYDKHPKCKGFNQVQVTRWARMFSKLYIWKMTEYERILYLDTDTIVLQDVSDYLALSGLFYGERSPTHRGINAGIMAIKTSLETFNELLEYARSNEPMVFWRSNQVGCTEQELLNRFWAAEHMSVKLNETRHADFLSSRFTGPVGRESMRENGAKIAHWVTMKCPKPWTVLYKDVLAKKYPRSRACDSEMFDKWHKHLWGLFDRVPSLSQFLPINDTQTPDGLQEHPHITK